MFTKHITAGLLIIIAGCQQYPEKLPALPATTDSTALEVLMQSLGETLPADVFSDLQKNQLSWQRFLQQDCAWEKKLWDDASVAQQMVSSCLQRGVEQRIERLKPMLCEGYGMTGPCEQPSPENSGSAIEVTPPGFGL